MASSTARIPAASQRRWRWIRLIVRMGLPPSCFVLASIWIEPPLDAAGPERARERGALQHEEEGRRRLPSPVQPEISIGGDEGDHRLHPNERLLILLRPHLDLVFAFCQSVSCVLPRHASDLVLTHGFR